MEQREQREHSRCGLTVAAGANLPDLAPSWRAATFDTRTARAEQRVMPRRHSQRERVYIYTYMHVDDDNYGKTAADVNEPACTEIARART